MAARTALARRSIAGDAMRTVREVSAGGVIYRSRGGTLEIALIHVRNRWGLPKGHIEPGERFGQTAVREVREETGLEGKLTGKLGEIRYSYRAKTTGGEVIRINKRVHFYLLRYIRGNVANHDHEVDEARWLPIHEAIERLKFASERKMVRRALGVLTARDRQSKRSTAESPSQ
jgi:8-oxo-dGTP pyrophosphatase MutT (NUDIX family)